MGNFAYFNFLIFLIIFNNSLQENNFGLKNILEREKEIISNKTNNYFKFSIKDKLETIYNKEIEIYISIINPEINNSLIITTGKNRLESSDSSKIKNSYYSNYYNFLGPTSHFFPNQNKSTNTTVYDTINNQTSNLNESEVLIQIVKDNIQGYDVNFLFLTNIFFYNFNLNCDFINELSWMNFYDFNFILVSDAQEQFKKCENQFNSLAQKYPNKLKFVKAFYSNKDLFTNEYINKKINRKIILNKLLDTKIYSRNDFNRNFKNNLIAKDIEVINKIMENFLKELLFTESYINSFDDIKFELHFQRLNMKIE